MTRFAASLTISLSLTPTASFGNEVPRELKAKILVTALTFAKTTAHADSNQLTLLVVGKCPMGDALKIIENRTLNGKPVIVIKSPEYSTPAELQAEVDARRPSYIYVCGASSKSIRQIQKVALARQIIVLADDAADVEEIAMLGVGLKDDGRPELVFNHRVAQQTGIGFDPRIFGFARVVR